MDWLLLSLFEINLQTIRLILTYFHLLPLVEQESSTRILRPTAFPFQFFAFVIHSFDVFFQSRCNVLFDLPLYFLLSGLKALWCSLMNSTMNPIHFYRLFIISLSVRSWLVLFHSTLLLMVCGQRTVSIIRI